VVEDGDRCVGRGDRFGDLFDLAFAGEERRVRPLAATFDDRERSYARARSELPCFFEAFSVIGLAEIEADQDCLGVTRWTFGHQKRRARETDINCLSFDRLGN
jgi:hypothetical protein